MKENKLRAEDLRCLNLVKCKISNDNGIYQVEKIDRINQVVMLSGARFGEWIPVDKIKPIPLTEEWILKAGFKNNKNSFYYYLKVNKPFYFFWNKEDGFGACTLEKEINEVVFDEVCIIKNIKYIHKLQDLYLYLIGNELEITI